MNRARLLSVVAVAVAVALLRGGTFETISAAPAKVDGALALRHVEKLVAIGPRPAGSPAGTRARDYLVAELKRASVPTQVRAFPTLRAARVTDMSHSTSGAL